jgi:hypothetical protein
MRQSELYQVYQLRYQENMKVAGGAVVSIILAYHIRVAKYFYCCRKLHPSNLRLKETVRQVCVRKYRNLTANTRP